MTGRVIRGMFAVVLSVFLVIVAVCAGVQPAHAESMPVRGKRVIIFGDSIQAHYNINSYGAFIETAMIQMGAIVTNRAESRATIGDLRDIKATKSGKRTTGRSIARNVLQQVQCERNLGAYDIYVIAAGTNDYGSVKLAGQKSHGHVTRANMAKALKQEIELINRANRNARILVVTPVNRWKKKKNCNTYNKFKDGTLNDYRNTISITASKYSNVKVIDGKSLKVRKSWLRKQKKHYLHPYKGYAQNQIASNFKVRVGGIGKGFFDGPDPDRDDENDAGDGENDDDYDED